MATQPSSAPDASSPTDARGANEAATVLLGPDDPGPVSVASAHFDAAGVRYEVVQSLGRGGMGEVTLCLDRRIGRKVALKREIHAGGSATSGRFVREICVQGQLEHPSIVPLYDVTVGSAGEVSFTMKRVRGRTLKSVLRALADGDRATAEEYTLHRLLGAFQSVCLAVAFGHSRGVIHRDLKPDNVMIGEFGEVYVLDWGVARIASGDEQDDEVVVHAPETAATEAGSVIGTPGYMAPEQWGRSRDADERSDVYALGAILFEILALRPLHEGDSAERIRSTLLGVDARVHVRAPDRETPPELEALCIEATATERAQRTPGARALHAAIERYLSQDRDLELRRTMANDHARAAVDAMDRALSGGVSAIADRERGLTEAGRALALDPSNEDARRALLRLLTEPPCELPEEAKAELQANACNQRKFAARAGIYTPMGLFLMIPLMLVMGVESWAAFIFLFASIAIYAAACAAVARASRPGNAAAMAVTAVGAIVATALSAAFGPFFVAPALATMSVSIGMGHVQRHRWLVFALCCMPVAGPVVAQAFGLAPPSYAFDGHAMLVLPRMLAFPAGGTTALLLSLNLVIIARSAFIAARQRRSTTALEERLVVQAWQLRRLSAAVEGA